MKASEGIRGFVHNVIAHPLWWTAEVVAAMAKGLHDVTAPK